MKKQTILFLFTITICQSLKAQNSVLGLETRQQMIFNGYISNQVGNNFVYPHQIKKPINNLFSKADTPLQQPVDTDGVGKKENFYADGALWDTFGGGRGNLGGFSIYGSINFDILNGMVASLGLQGDQVNSKTEITAVNFLFGHDLRKKKFLMTASSGLGIVNQPYPKPNPANSSYYDDQYAQRTTVGIPLLLQGYYLISHRFGIGANGYLNLNTIKNTTGFTINMAYFPYPILSKKKTLKKSKHDI